jgi:hypothetical protein
MFNWLLKIVQIAIDPADIFDQLSTLNKRITQMALDVSALEAEITRVQTVQASAITLIQGVVTELEAVKAELSLKNAHVEPPLDTSALDKLVGDLKSSTDAFSAAVADSWDKKDVVEVVLHADDPTTPTTTVIMPEVLPENVTVTTEVLVDVIDPVSTEPQVAIVVEEAPAPAPVEVVAEGEVAAPVVEAPVEPVVEEVIKTEEGLVDVTVTAPEAAVVEMATEGVEVMADVVAAFESTEEVTAAPVVEAPAAEVAAEAPAAEVAPEAPTA